MFTGLIQDQGRLEKVLKNSDASMSFYIKTQLDPQFFKKGRSISVDGVCLTVEEFDPIESCFRVSLVSETLNRTRFAQAELASHFNLELPLSLSTLLDGHLVSGHVDACAVVIQEPPFLGIQIPEGLERFIAFKGSLALNGVSLTVASLNENECFVALIPETLAMTNLSHVKVGDLIHLEVDLIARYLERLQKNS